MNTIDIMMVALLNIKGMGRKTVKGYIDKYGIHEEDTTSTIIKNIADYATYNKRIKVPSVSDFEANLIKARDLLGKQEENNIVAINMLSEQFPNKLKCIEDCPVIIYAKGNLDLLNGSRHIAIIGTRDVTNHGYKVGERLGELLAKKGKVVVSGLAIGCDSSGHRGCIAANGETIAIMPCPLDEVFPKNNKPLAQEILANNGLLISEYQIGQKVQRGFYVERDRLQSAMSEGIVVIETDIVGGTMHTVEFCKRQGKVLACYKHPNKYLNLKQTKGNQKLLDEGEALPLESESDIDRFIAETEKVTYPEGAESLEEQIGMELWEKEE